MLFWEGRKDLQRYFNDFLRAQTYPHEFDPKTMPRRWVQAQTVLSGAKLQMELRGALGSATLSSTK